MFLQGGEFAFVLYAAATSGGVIDARENALFVTVVILSMAMTPLFMIAADRLLRTEALMDDGRCRAQPEGAGTPYRLWPLRPDRLATSAVQGRRPCRR